MTEIMTSLLIKKRQHPIFYQLNISLNTLFQLWHYRDLIISNHQPDDCLLNRLFRRRSKKASKLRGTGLCAGNSPVPGEFPAQSASNAENVSIWWRHRVRMLDKLMYLFLWRAMIRMIYCICDNLYFLRIETSLTNSCMIEIIALSY